MQPWSVKYQPKNCSQIQGQNSGITQLKEFINDFPKKKAALIYGPPGCGKTCSVYALANEINLELIEVNASDVRNADSLKAKLGQAINSRSLFSTGKLILVDEVDGVSGSADRGGLSALSKLIDETKFPIILTANDPWNKKFSLLRKKSEMIEFRNLSYLSVLSVLKKIAEAQRISYDEDSLTSLARRAGGDLRGAINDLQTLAELTQSLSKADLDELFGRRQKDTMINALMRILKTTNPEVALPALDDVDEDIDEIFLWLDENIPKEYKKTSDLAAAYDNLSTADVFRGRIQRWQHWRFLVYIYNLLTAGIALSKKEKYIGFNKYTRTTRILKMWQYNQKNSKKKAIAQKIADKTHTSVKRVISDTFPYIKQMFVNKKYRNNLEKYFELNKEELAYLTS